MGAVNSVLAATTSAGTAAAASPVLASWATQLSHDVRNGWWRPRRVGVGRVAAVGVTAAALAAAASRGSPGLAWWLLATVGTVLATVDLNTHRLPVSLMAPLAAAELLILTATAVAGGHGGRLGRACAAAAVIGGLYLMVALAIPSAIGLGDIYLISITIGILAWTAWHTALVAQAILWLIAPAALLIALSRAEVRTWNRGVPMGPAIVVSAVLACWV